MENHLADYARDGYCVIPDALSLEEVGAINTAIDADLKENRRLWRRGNYPGVRNSLVLLSRPEFDVTMRPPGLVPLMEGIMGADLCADQHEVVIRPPNPEGPSQCEWHRDGTRPMSPPYYTYLLHLVIYLTRVGDDTHCFSVIPGSSQGREFPPIEEYDLDSAVHITGEPGTAILCNGAILHALNFRKTAEERRSVHCWIGRSSQPAMANHTIFPRRLCRSEDAETARFYSRANEITHLMRNHF